MYTYKQALYSSALPHGGGIGFQWGIKTETSRWTLYMSCFFNSTKNNLGNYKDWFFVCFGEEAPMLPPFL